MVIRKRIRSRDIRGVRRHRSTKERPRRNTNVAVSALFGGVGIEHPAGAEKFKPRQRLPTAGPQLQRQSSIGHSNTGSRQRQVSLARGVVKRGGYPRCLRAAQMRAYATTSSPACRNFRVPARV